MEKKSKKILDISLKLVAWFLIAFTVFIMIFTVVTVTTVDRNDRSIFGVRFYIVQTDSMSKSENNADMDIHFNAGDIVLIKKLKDNTSLSEGDVIAFLSTNSESYGETVTHMIRERKYENGKFVGYVTYGTNTGTNDEALVEPEYVIGKYTGKLPGVGRFFAFLRSANGYVVFILIPFALLILYNGVNVILLLRKYKKEQKAEIEAEKKQNEELLMELKTLKAQLANQGGNVQSADNTEEGSDT